MHWSERYLDIPHAELDCAQLVERVLHEQFSRDVRFPRRERDDLFHRAGLITRHASDFAKPIDTPYDGCGVLMLARGRQAHIGLYCAIEGGRVLHSDSAFGSSVCMPLAALQTTIKIKGWYAWL
ncbi:hypothetical protein [uncultured Pseudacidovorax sp.]|uniref:hypothetical protein n=1 Tax=uncultured Pseudacidovorax sp. TaxID=679313 RepID=UPI0025F9208A|nr:hypothetical protein [uncultured Pseudacidovorax sp.]